MDGSDGTVGFEALKSLTIPRFLILPNALSFSFRFFFLTTILLPSNICVLGYSSLNEVPRPLVSLKREVKLLSITECYLVSARRLKVT